MKNKTKFMYFLCLLSSFTIAAQISFIEDTSQLFEGAANGGLTFADIDNDGDQDFLTTGLNIDLDTLTILYRNDGIGNFEKVTNTPFGYVAHGDAVFGDVDKDGDKDLIIAGLNKENISSTKLYLNDGLGNFTEVGNTLFEALSYGKIAFADIDNDDDDDVILSGTRSESGGFTFLISEVYFNDGLGNFSSPFDDLTTYGSFDIADVDGDNDLDILISGSIVSSSEPTATLYLNAGNGEFVEKENTSFIGVFGATVNFADIDADADVDVLITGTTNTFGQSSEIYINDGAGNFTATVVSPTWVEFGACGFADVDLDQDQEMLITGYASGGNGPVTKLYSNNGSGSFSEVSDLPFIDIMRGAIEFVDVDGDTDKDLFITGFDSTNSSQAKLYINDFTISATKAPVIFSAKAYPNPFDEYFNLNFENASDKITIELSNVLGQVVLVRQIASSGEIELSTTHLKGGLYFLNMKNEKGKSKTIPIYKN